MYIGRGRNKNETTGYAEKYSISIRRIFQGFSRYIRQLKYRQFYRNGREEIVKLRGYNLGKNDRGEDVRVLQNELLQIGFIINDKELQEASFGENTREAVMKFQEEHDLTPNGIVDDETAKAIEETRKAYRNNEVVVQGQVRMSDGIPAPGVRVQSYDGDVRKKELLIETKTDKDGRYEIKYSVAKIREFKKVCPDLHVRVLGPGEEILAESPINYKATSRETVDFTIVYKEKCMKIKNALWSPLAIELSKEKILTMKPRGTETISDKDFESPGCKKLFKEEKIFVIPEDMYV